MKVINRFLFALLISHTVSAQTVWHVSYEGDDQNSGSEASPFLTVSRAVGAAQSGHVILVRGSIEGQPETYYGRESLNCQGAEDSPIRIRPLDGQKPIFDVGGISIPFNGAAIAFDGSRHCTFEGMEVRNSSGRGISMYQSVGISILGNTVHHIAERGIGGSGAGILIEGNTVFQSARANRRDDPAHESPYQNGGWAAAISSYRWWGDNIPSSDWVIRDNRVFENWGEGIIAYMATGIRVEDNEVRDNWSVNLYVDKAQDAVLQRNYVHTTNRTFDRRGLPARGVMIANEAPRWEVLPTSRRITLANNLITNVSRGISFFVDGGNTAPDNTYSGVKIIHNTIYGQWSEGIVFQEVPDGSEQPSGNVIFNNIIDDTWSLGDLDTWTIAGNAFPDGLPPGAPSGSNIVADPDFVGGAGVEAFRLAANSPLLALGVETEIDEDYFGTARPPMPDIGFHENEVAGFPVSLRLQLQGFAQAGVSNVGGTLPSSQPFAGPPWNYSGDEQWSGDPADVVDWVLLELVGQDGLVAARRAAILLPDGAVVESAADGPVVFGVPAGAYLVVVRHRNHLAVASTAVLEIGG